MENYKKQTQDKLKCEKSNLVIRVEQSESTSRIKLLNGIDEPIPLERLGGGVRGLDPEAGTRVVGKDGDHASWMSPLVADRDGLEQNWFDITNKQHYCDLNQRQLLKTNTTAKKHYLLPQIN